MADTDWGDLYLQHVDAVAALAPGLSGAELEQTVPASPEWTVHDVLRHLAGGPADLLAGRLDGVPGPAWTQRHVDERRDASAAELVAEMRSNAEPAAASAREAETPAAVWDVVVHHADLHEALGRGRLPVHYWGPVLEALRPRVPVELAGVDDYELFRALFSRRSRSQLAGWDTGADPAVLDKMCVFGPREDDQPVPSTT